MLRLTLESGIVVPRHALEKEKETHEWKNLLDLRKEAPASCIDGRSDTAAAPNLARTTLDARR